MKLLIGASSSKIFHLKEFANVLENLGTETKVVLDVDYSDGYPSRKISHWFQKEFKFEKLIQEFRPDVIFVDRQRHFGLSAIKSKIPLLVHLRGDFWEEMKMAERTLYKSFPKKIALKKWQEIAHQCFKDSSVILPICEYLKQKTLEKYPNNNVKVLYQGIEPKNWFEESGMTLKHPCVGLVQSATIWDKTKELLILKDVLKKLPNVTFYWVGDGPYKEKILDELNKFDNFIWLGALEYPKKIRQFLTEIDIYGLVSGIDMAPLTLLEAQLMKKPVIASKVGGVPEFLKDKSTGFLVQQNNSKQMMEQINFLINDEKTASKMANEGYEFVSNNFNWNVIGKSFYKIIQDLQI